MSINEMQPSMNLSTLKKRSMLVLILVLFIKTMHNIVVLLKIKKKSEIII